MAKDRKYEVGYGKPPQHSRFKKGQPSPNPAGRRKGTSKAKVAAEENSFDALKRRVFSSKLAVRDAQGTREVEAQEAILLALLKAATGGNAHALKTALQLLSEMARDDLKRVEEAAERKQQAFERVKLLREQQRKVWEVASQSGNEPDKPWPHPDDIFIDEEKQTWHVRGPYRASDLPMFEWIRACRDENFAQVQLDLRRRTTEKLTPTVWDIAFASHESLLPLRWQILPRYWEVSQRYDRMTPRAIEAHAQECAAEAERLGKGLGIRRDKKTYRMVNGILKPLLSKIGYRSLAEFEHSP